MKFFDKKEVPFCLPIISTLDKVLETKRFLLQREIWKRTLCRGAAGRMSTILVSFYYLYGLWHDIHACRHRFSEIPIHLKCSQLLEVGFPQHPSFNAVGWPMSSISIQMKHHMLGPRLLVGCLTLLQIELATVCAAGLSALHLSRGLCILPAVIGGRIKPLNTRA